MRPLRYAINVTLDGCCDHRAGLADEESHHYWADRIAHAGALLYGRVTYQMMEEAWRVRPGPKPEWHEPWMEPFVEAIDPARKYVVSSTLDAVDWNAELVRGDLETAIREIKSEPGEAVLVGGLRLPLALAELGLIDEYEFVVQPRIAGHGPTPFAGLSTYVDLELVDRRDFESGSVALSYRAKR